MIEQTRLSLKYVRITVTFEVAGAPVSPTADTVQMAFMAAGAIPGSSDWQSASWETAGSAYYARCLVGPGGTITLAPGTYTIWIKVIDAPEIPVETPAQLSIT